LETLYPVVQGSQVVIPAHTQVQGAVEHDRRPGHVRRTAEFKFRFTSLIFPNNHVAPIDGALQSVPGSKTARTEGKDGTLRTVDQTEKVVTPMFIGAVTGGILGSVQHTGVGTYVGAGLGAGLGLGGVLLKRGDEINLPRGANIEMSLQSPLILEPEQASFNAQYVPTVAAAIETKDARSDRDEDHQDTARKSRSRRSVQRTPPIFY
jgi:hypothetical protein